MKNKQDTAKQVSLSALSFLIVEIVQHFMSTDRMVSVEDKLHDMGRKIGPRLFEEYSIREDMVMKKETKVVNQLQFICNDVWKHLFGRPAELLKTTPDVYQIYDKFGKNVFHHYVSTRDVNCGYCVAGMIEAAMTESGFPCSVTAHHTDPDSSVVQGLVLQINLGQVAQ